MSKTVKLNNGLEMPSLGLGTRQVEASDIEVTLNNALEAGYRHFDTAFFYKNEKRIGNIFKKWFESGKIRREDLFIVSKLPHIGMWPYRVNEFMKLSLADLGLDYVDLYLIQFPVGFVYTHHSDLVPLNDDGKIVLDNKIHLEAVWKAMEHEVRRGRAKAIGCCNFNQSQLQRILSSCQIPPAVVQLEANIYSQQKQLKQFCHQQKIQLCAFSPLGPRHSHVTSEPEILRLGQKYGKTPAQIALRFLVQSGFAVVQKSTNSDRIKENIEIFDFELDNEDMEHLESLDRAGSGVYKPAFDFGTIYPGSEEHPEFPWK